MIFLTGTILNDYGIYLYMHFGPFVQTWIDPDCIKFINILVYSHEYLGQTLPGNVFRASKVTSRYDVDCIEFTGSLN